MLRPTAVKVEVICAYQILVEFDNGEKNILMWSLIFRENGMESCGYLNILRRLLRMVLRSYGLMVRIFARMSCMI